MKRSLLSLIPLLGLGSAPAPQGEVSVLRSFTAPRELPDADSPRKGGKPSDTAHRGMNQRQKRLWNRRAGRVIFGCTLMASLSAHAGFAPPEPLEPPPGWRMQDLGTRIEAFIIAIAEQWWG